MREAQRGSERRHRSWPWQRREEGRADAQEHGSLTVVLADDVEPLRALVRATLEPEHTIVCEASNGREAVECCRSERPDAIILDLNMPQHDGLEAIAPIRAASPETAIVVLSGLAPELIADKALALGADAFVDKASAIDDLPAILVDAVLRRRS